MAITDPERVVKKFRPDAIRTQPAAPRYNVAPSQAVPSMIRTAEGRVLGELRWGLVPHWADDPAIGGRMINARSETVTEKPAFREAFRRHRCLIAADGFYEWQRQGDHKQPYFFRVDGGEPFALAGLYAIWTKGERLATCTILTTTPNAVMQPIHDRMPVILDAADWDRWMDPACTDPAALLPLLRPFPADRMHAIAVSTWVNAPAHDDPRCIEPLAAAG